MNDLKFTARQLLKHPGFTMAALLMLGLGIGANTAIFSVINSLLFKPLAIERPREVVRLHSRSVNPEAGYRSFSYPNFADIRDRNEVFRELAAFQVSLAGVTEGDTTRRVFAMAVTANYFQMFGPRPLLGRDFLPEEERPGAGMAVAMLSDRYWKRLGADPGIIGQTLRLNGTAFEIVGVTAEGFTGTSSVLAVEIYVPLGVHAWVANDFMGARGRSLSERDHHCLLAIGRLREGLSLDQAGTRLEALARRLREAYPAENNDQTLVVAPPSRLSLNVAPSNDAEVAGLTALLLPMAGVVLLIACLNLANMMLARGAARQKEFAIRAALGGGRVQIMRQVLCEGLLLSLGGGLVALALAFWVGRLLGAAFAGKLPFMTLALESGLDGRVLAVTFLFCLLATLLAALMPALRLSKIQVMRDLKEHGDGGRRDTAGWRLGSSRNVLVTGQVALSFLLLVVAGMFFRGAVKAAEANPGFRFEQGVVAELDPSLAGYSEERSRQVYRAVLEEVRRLPEIEAASLASSIPFGMFSDGRSIGRPGTGDAQQRGQPLSEDERPVYVNYAVISEDYFRSLGTLMLKGREFSRLEAEGATQARVAILDEAAAERLWPGADSLGRQLEILDGGEDRGPLVVEVVGIAPGLKAAIGDEQAGPFLYLPVGQAFQSMLNLHLRLRHPGVEAEQAMVATVRSVLSGVDDRLPVLSLNTLRDFHHEGLMMWLFRAVSRLFLSFALVALALAALGVYGVKAFVVARRTREIGIRMALGASRAQVIWLVLRGSLQLTMLGLAVGSVLALGAGQLLRSMLFGVSAADPLSFVVALVVLGVTAMVASYLPARRAAQIDPLKALRSE